MASQQLQESAGGYMDSVRVKISEKYKPPPKIGLAVSYAQRLTLNKQIRDTIPHYEFFLEQSVVDKMREWRSARAVMFQELKARVENAKQEEQKREKNVEFEEISENETEIASSNDDYLNSGPSHRYQRDRDVLMPIRATTSAYSNILTPIPLREQAVGQNVDYKSPEKSPFNISDFEADTSSPFDNMELKSINDLEELAQVLKGGQESKLNYSTSHSATTIQYPIVGSTSYSYNIPNTASYIPTPSAVPSLYSNTNGYYYSPETIPTNPALNPPFRYSNQTESKNYSCSPVQDTKLSHYKSIPDIMKTLQNELDHSHLDNTNNADNNTRSAEVFSKSKSRSDDSEEFKSLPKNVQDISKSISSMGFPLSRVARVCKILGNDQKKVVEHLLAMSDLLDLGFPESSVSRALLQCDNDRDKALDILIS